MSVDGPVNLEESPVSLGYNVLTPATELPIVFASMGSNPEFVNRKRAMRLTLLGLGTEYRFI